MPYRVRSTGAKDPRTFYLYSYGFPLDHAKTVQSVRLPGNTLVKVAAITLAN